ncbi:Homoserine/homoserine lactone efflux protein [Thalassocella blandensis]|nr:Homoserine/homoserine lactone efflux protein [Thalassocella blandensis]
MSEFIPSGILTFIVISIGLILVPGPNVLVIVSTSLVHGKTRGLQAVIGTSVAMMLQLTIVAFSTAVFVSALSRGLVVLKWLGIAYLLYMAFVEFKALCKFSNGRDMPVAPLNALGSFRRGFIVSLLNPKTLVFFSAFLPQFITSQAFYFNQILVLSALFWMLALVLDSSYALMAGLAKNLVQQPRFQHAQHGVIGSLYVIAAALLSKSRA